MTAKIETSTATPELYRIQRLPVGSSGRAYLLSAAGFPILQTDLKTMIGHGALAVFLSRLGDAELYQRWKDVFGKNVTDRLFRAIPLLVPLFGAQSFQKVSEQELVAWFDSFELYLAESVEDNGFL